MKLDKVNIVHHDDNSAHFAKQYVKGHKGDYGTTAGMSKKHEKDSGFGRRRWQCHKNLKRRNSI